MQKSCQTKIIFVMSLLICFLVQMAALAQNKKAAATTKPSAPVALIDVKCIWDKAPHNAFTDLIFYKGKWYCTFREGSKHVSNDGIVRVIASADGAKWESVAEFASKTEDTREFKFSISPDQKLMLIGAACDVSSGNRGLHQSYVYYTQDGKKWSEPVKAGDLGYWMWRMVWHKGTAYSFGYKATYPNGSLRLYSSTDGLTWKTLVGEVFVEGFPNETAEIFLEDDTMVCLLRRETDDKTAQIGTAKPPYIEWTWKSVGMRIGSPSLVKLPDGQIVAPIRLLNPMRTALCKVDIQEGTLTEMFKLPSGGDNGYTGAVVHNNKLWVSYYSCHQDKQSKIYLAKIPLEMFKEKK